MKFGNILFLLLFGIFAILSCTVVKYRVFRDEEKYYETEGWLIGTPYVDALHGVSDKKLWDDNYFYTEVPVHYKNDKGNETAIRYIKDKLIGIDSVLITFLSLKEVFIRKPLTYDSVQTFDYIQDYKNSPVCFTMDSLTIPPNEDSIQVDFIFWEKDINSGNKIETPFSFKLKRYESTHLGMWGGK